MQTMKERKGQPGSVYNNKCAIGRVSDLSEEKGSLPSPSQPATHTILVLAAMHESPLL